MKITQMKLALLSAPLRVPFRTALREVSAVEDVVVELTDAEGRVGRGEAPPTAAVTGETLGSITAALRGHIGPALVGREFNGLDEIFAAIAGSIKGNSSAKAAAEIAVWDLYAQQCDLPLYKLLGGGKTSIVTDLTISVNEPDVMERDAAYAIAQ